MVGEAWPRHRNAGFVVIVGMNPPIRSSGLNVRVVEAK